MHPVPLKPLISQSVFSPVAPLEKIWCSVFVGFSALSNIPRSPPNGPLPVQLVLIRRAVSCTRTRTLRLARAVNNARARMAAGAGTAGGEMTDGDVLASLRALRTTLAKETEDANSSAVSRDKVRARVAYTGHFAKCIHLNFCINCRNLYRSWLRRSRPSRLTTASSSTKSNT